MISDYLAQDIWRKARTGVDGYGQPTLGASGQTKGRWLEKRRLGFLLGAGTSMAIGLPGIHDLTAGVRTRLEEPFSKLYEALRTQQAENATVENVLTRVRLCREIASAGTTDALSQARLCDLPGLDCVSGCILDQKICRSICDIVSTDPREGLTPHLTFGCWLRQVARDYPVEIFTTNYDLLVERAFEQTGVCFFDGFVGSVAPFFAPECVEADGSKGTEAVFPPRAWVRLWKLHGSVGWRLLNDSGTGVPRIARFAAPQVAEGDEIMIFPSRDKYVDSRKLPFLSYQDRFRRFLSTGEVLLVVLGYSFGDEHINEVLFQALRANTRLAITALLFEPASEALLTHATTHKNLSLYDPDSACVGGVLTRWVPPTGQPAGSIWQHCWDQAQGKFTLGDFRAFCRYLEMFTTRPAAETASEPRIAVENLAQESQRP